MDRKIIVIAHNIRSSHNVGSILRTCDGIGVDKVYLTGYTPYPAVKNDSRLPHIAGRVSKQIEKTALGAQKHLDWQYEPGIDDVLGPLSSDGYVICALEQSDSSVRLNEFKFPQKTVLLLGNEVDGIDEETLNKTNHVLEIPMFGKKESFNVVQAAAMALYAFRFSAS